MYHCEVKITRPSNACWYGNGHWWWLMNNLLGFYNLRDSRLQHTWMFSTSNPWADYHRTMDRMIEYNRTRHLTLCLNLALLHSILTCTATMPRRFHCFLKLFLVLNLSSKSYPVQSILLTRKQTNGYNLRCSMYFN